MQTLNYVMIVRCKARAYAQFPRNEAILALLAPKVPSLFLLAAIKVIDDYEQPQESGMLDDIFTQANKVVTIQRENQRQQPEAEAKLLEDRQAAIEMIKNAPKLKAMEEGFARLGLGFNH